jgi:DNA-binding NarL/FixJ family response regulator
VFPAPGVSAFLSIRETATIRKVQLNRIRVLIIDHNPLLREGLSVLIRLHSDMELTGAAESADESVRLFRDRRPHVVLMDLDLPLGAGISAIQAIRAIDPSACLIGLCTYEWDRSNTEALRAGACNCLTKDRLNTELIALVRKCHSEGCNRANGR